MSKTPIMYKINKFHNMLFGKEVYYIYSMTIYHLITIIYTSLFGKIPSHVTYMLTLNANVMYDYFSLIGFTQSIAMVIIIILIDMVFLIILYAEFRPKWLEKNTLAKINAISIITLIVGLLFPYFREIMFFMSINTLTITLTYKIIKWSPKLFMLKYVFLLGSYIYIIKLLFYPLYMIIYYAYLT